VNPFLLRTHHVLLVLDGERLYAMSSICPHRGCDVQPNPDRRASTPLACPCHDSDFDTQGRPTGGPARTPLRRLAVTLDDRGHVIVDTSREFGPERWSDPMAFIRLPA
jgi:cytochrome b6-f complex iron-sulfur subunit